MRLEAGASGMENPTVGSELQLYGSASLQGQPMVGPWGDVSIGGGPPLSGSGPNAPGADVLLSAASQDPVGFVLTPVSLDADGKEAVDLLALSVDSLRALYSHYGSARSRS